MEKCYLLKDVDGVQVVERTGLVKSTLPIPSEFRQGGEQSRLLDAIATDNFDNPYRRDAHVSCMMVSEFMDTNSLQSIQCLFDDIIMPRLGNSDRKIEITEGDFAGLRYGWMQICMYTSLMLHSDVLKIISQSGFLGPVIAHMPILRLLKRAADGEKRSQEFIKQLCNYRFYEFFVAMVERTCDDAAWHDYQMYIDKIVDYCGQCISAHVMHNVQDGVIALKYALNHSYHSGTETWLQVALFGRLIMSLPSDEIKKVQNWSEREDEGSTLLERLMLNAPTIDNFDEDAEVAKEDTKHWKNLIDRVLNKRLTDIHANSEQALQEGLRRGQLDLVKLLVKYGANLDTALAAFSSEDLAYGAWAGNPAFRWALKQ